MKHIQLTVTFTDASGVCRHETLGIETEYELDAAGMHRYAYFLSAELKVRLGKRQTRRHDATASAWLHFPNRPVHLDAGVEQFYDLNNSQALWLELGNLITRAEFDLIMSHAFKMLEPHQEPTFDDEAEINEFYYLHDRKMNLMNQVVRALVKVQDLVYRLLHESLGGDLVDTGQPKWEQKQLRRKNVIKGLEAQAQKGKISRPDFEAITAALAIPENAPHAATAVSYRNRLLHHSWPSVDYSIFYSPLKSRAAAEITDPQGKVIGLGYLGGGREPAEFAFNDLHRAFSAYLEAVVEMLDRLSRVEVLRR